MADEEVSNSTSHCHQMHALLTLFKENGHQLKLKREWLKILKEADFEIEFPILSSHFTGNRNNHRSTTPYRYKRIVEIVDAHRKKDPLLANYLYNKEQKKYIEPSTKIREDTTGKKYGGVVNILDDTYNYFWGIYVGYYIRPSGVKGSPRKDNTITKLTLLLSKNTEQNCIEVRVRTKEAEHENPSKPYYEGKCQLTDKILKLNFGIEKDSSPNDFMFVFNIQTRLRHDEYDGYLKGIYGGVDLGTCRPISGRMILKQREDWETLNKKGGAHKIISDYLTDEQYRPFELDDDASVQLLADETYGEFFLKDGRYTEQIDIVEKYNIDIAHYDMLKDSIKGSYSFFFLDHSGEYIHWAISCITSLGYINVNGSKKDKKTSKKYSGIVNLLENNNAYISITNENNDDDVICYLVKMTRNDDCPYYNGVRIRIADNGEDFKPIASRVVFVKENDHFYSPDKTMTPVALFPKSKEQVNALDGFNEKYPGVSTLLMGFENNIVKTFSDERKNFIRDIDYGMSFGILAKHWAREKNLDKTLLFLYYAQKHGNNKAILLKDKSFSKMGSKIMEHIETYQITQKSEKLFKVKNSSISEIKRKVRRERMAMD